MFDPSLIHIQGLDTVRPKRILVCQLKQIGDVLLATPTIRLLKKLYPGVSIDFYTLKHCAPILENNPDIDKVWTVDKSLGLLDTLKFYWQAGRDGYDMIFDCQQLPRITYMLLLSNAPVKFTYTPPWYRKFLYTHWHTVKGPYAARCKASPFIHLFGNDIWDDPRPRLYTTKDEKAWAGAFLKGSGLKNDETLITVDSTHRRASRRWPAEHYGEFIRQAAEKQPDLKFFLLFGPGERDDAKTVLDTSGCPDRCILAENVLSLREMAAVIEKAAFHIGNCSAPSHFAAALDTPSMTIRGATSDAWTCPKGGHEHVIKGLDCQPCNVNQCPEGHYRCLTELLPETVTKRFLERLAQL